MPPRQELGLSPAAQSITLHRCHVAPALPSCAVGSWWLQEDKIPCVDTTHHPQSSASLWNLLEKGMGALLTQILFKIPQTPIFFLLFPQILSRPQK